MIRVKLRDDVLPVLQTNEIQILQVIYLYITYVII